MSAAVHYGLSVRITNQLAAVVFSCYCGGNVVVVSVVAVVIIIISGVDVAVGGVDGRVSVSVVI